MLAENTNFAEIAKPQIMQHPTGRKNFKEKPYDGKENVDSIPISSDYIEDVSKKHDDLETNTEDSEKQMRKADSGILIESEITEPSENIDLKRKSEPSVSQKSENKDLSSPCSEVRTQSATSNSEGGKENAEPEEKVGASKDILQTINDLQSEVHSLSEQLYSLDFDEEIPEDLTKSDVSENITNENNTSMSIEEILSDHHSDDSDEVKSSVVVLEKSDEIDIISEIAENVEVPENPVDIGENETSRESKNVLDAIPIAVESDRTDTDAERMAVITSEESLPVKENSVFSQEDFANAEKDGKSSENPSFSVLGEDGGKFEIQNLPTETEESDVREEIHDIESLSDDFEDAVVSKVDTKKEVTPEIVDSDESDRTIQEEDILPEGSAPSIKSGTSSDSEFGLFNVKNISEIEISEQDVAEKRLSDGEVPSSAKDSILEDIKSMSSLEQISQGVESMSKLMIGSDENETKTSHELIKIDYLNESEGSDAPGVDEGVLPVDEIKTVMDDIKFSTSDTSVVVKSPVDVRQNYNNVLVNLKSYFDSKIKDSAPDDIKETLKEIGGDFVQSAAKNPEELVLTSPMKVVHFSLDNLEETDVSESLEYDAVPVAISDEGIMKHVITDLDDGAKSPQLVVVTTAREELGVRSGTDVANHSNREEASREKDRSVEEIVEDHSIPNLLGETFVVHEDSTSDANVTEEFVESVASILEEQVSENLEVSMADDDLEQITEDETPFLQALKREKDNLIARRKDSLDKMAADLFETLIEDNQDNLILSEDQKMNDYESEAAPIGE